MTMSGSVRRKLIAAAGGGSMLIATLFLGGKEGAEGRTYKAYQDVAGVRTVCDGHTGSDIISGRQYSDSDCDRLLQNDLRSVKKVVDGVVKVPLSEYQRASLYSFAYNIGPSAFTRSTLLKKLNAGDRAQACEELRRWVYAGGIKWRRLMHRRDMERALCLAESSDDLADK